MKKSLKNIWCEKVKVFIFAPAKRNSSFVTKRYFYRLRILLRREVWEKSLKKVIKKFGRLENSFYLCTRNSNETGYRIGSE